MHKKILDTLNFPKTVCHVVLGHDHSHGQRMIVGSVVMVVGVTVAKLPFHDVHFFLDLFGYAIHGMGLVPFIECYSEHLAAAHKE